MILEFIDEFKLDKITKEQIANLLKECFPEEDFHGRTYFKQLPHYRLIMKEDNRLIGQLGLDYRIMKLGEMPIRVLGIIDLAISPELQGQGYGTRLLTALNEIAENNVENIDFLLLTADKYRFYENCGYTLIKQKVKWLTIEEHINYGLQSNTFDNYLMIKQIGTTKWLQDAELDLFGYWY